MLAALLFDMGEDDPDDYEGEKLLVDGDFLVEGNLDLGTADVSVLVVRGNLKVTGYFRDRSDDGPTMTLIVGNLTAKNDLLMPVEIEYDVRGGITAQEHIPAFTSNRLSAPPSRLHSRFYATNNDGSATLFAGEAGDGFVAAIEGGETILAIDL